MASIWGIALLWSLLSVSRGSLVECGLLQASSSSAEWAGQAAVIGLYPRQISNEGHSRLFADLRAPACPAVSDSLLLVLATASPSGEDVELEGAMLSNCSGAVFPSGAATVLRNIPPGSYPARLVFGAEKWPIAFAADGEGGNGSSASGKPSTVMVTVVTAPVGSFVGQAAAASSTSLTVTLSAALDQPSTLPVTMGLRLSDPTAAEIIPPVLTWRPGESWSKAFTLRLWRPLGPSEPAVWAEAVTVSNLVFGAAGAAPPRVALQAPVPRFYAAVNQAVYRPADAAVPASEGGTAATGSLGGGGGGDRGGGSGGGRDLDGGMAAFLWETRQNSIGGRVLDYVKVAVRRASPNPFLSTLNWTAHVEGAMGCDDTDCSLAVFGSGQLSFPADSDAATVTVTVNWTAVPMAAILRVGLRLRPVANAAVLALADNATSLSVYGTVYGTCPAGTTGPWQAPTAAPPPPPPGLGQPPSSPPSGPSGACDDAALRQALLVDGAADPPAPVLIACVGGRTTVVFPANSGPASPAPGSSASNTGGVSASPIQTDPSSALLRAPFGYDAAAVFVPLTGADEAVVALNSSCAPAPLWGKVPAPPNTTAPASTAVPTAWAQWSLPGTPSASDCFSFLAVNKVTTAPRSSPAQAGQQGAPSPAPSRGLLQATTNQTSKAPARSPPVKAAFSAGTSTIRTLGLTLRPTTSPPPFSSSSLALALRHQPSGRYLPLCGLPPDVLRAAGAVAYGGVFNASDAEQLAWVHRRMGLAIRGDPQALWELYLGPNGAASEGARRNALGSLGASGGVLGRWTAGGRSEGLAASEAAEELRPDWGGGADGEVDGGGRAGAAGRRGLAGGATQLRGEEDGGRRLQRRALQGEARQQQEQQPQPSRALTSQSESSSDGADGAWSSSLSFADLPVGSDGFDLTDAAAGGTGALHVLFNPAYVEFCSVWEPQVVDLERASDVYAMTLEASSGDATLRQLGSGGNVVVNAAMRAELVVRRDEAAAAAAAASRSQPSRSPTPGQAAATYGGQLQFGQGGDNGGSSPSGADCSSTSGAPSPVPDQRRLVSLLSRDGLFTLSFNLNLFLDYAAAAAAAVKAAAALPPCSPSASNASGNSTPPPASRPAPPWQPPTTSLEVLALALKASPPPLSPLDACRPCRGGSFSALANATMCLPCEPGNYSADAYNTQCRPCPAGMFTFTWNSTACKPCVAGSFTPRSGATACSVCPAGTTTMADGGSDCVSAPPPPSRSNGTRFTLVVSFGVMLNMSQPGSSFASLAANNTGIDAQPDDIVKLLIAADTAVALRIWTTQVRVNLIELSPSTFLVNVSAIMPVAQVSDDDDGSGNGSGAPDGSSDGKEVDADTLISRLVDNPEDSFPRTKQATGGSLQVQYMHRQVVTLDRASSGVNIHVVVWPTLAGTAVLAVVVGFACSRYCRKRRGRLGGVTGGLPPITDALGRLCAWKGPTSPQPAYLVYGQLTSLELQDMPGSSSAVPRHRGGRGGSKALGSEGQDSTMGSVPTADLDVLTMMYTREALAAPRI